MLIQKYFYRLRFSRKGNLRFLSHLEQIELIRRAIRRAKLPMNFTEGFHPQLKVSFGPAISVGYESNCELVDIETAKLIDSKELAKKLTAQLPAGFSLVEIKRIPSFFTAIEPSVNFVEYTIENLNSFLTEEETESKIRNFFDQKDLFVDVIKKDKIQQVNLVPLIKEMYLDNNKLVLKLNFRPKRNIKVEKIVEAVFGIKKEQLKLLKICREMIYLTTEQWK